MFLKFAEQTRFPTKKYLTIAIWIRRFHRCLLKIFLLGTLTNAFKFCIFAFPN
jgi:hypothetical protein